MAKNDVKKVNISTIFDFDRPTILTTQPKYEEHAKYRRQKIIMKHTLITIQTIDYFITYNSRK